MAGLSDVGSTPTVSTIKKPDVLRIRFFYGIYGGYKKAEQAKYLSSME